MSGAIKSVTIVSDISCQMSIPLSATICRVSRTRMTADLAALERATLASFTNFEAISPVVRFW